ncbi:hypothetical protein OOZ19_01855 [Saccharopolyspora sp. NFXS83]|uniref:hypothetical protein n=1 Tax=Saccharopolyspora sp. NFXS83 TaxID=2993560 RepID=UPI00224ADA0F|nr:hypothetical protein [Saccharopolyspora sp. NFXS83]MCX2728972.1 hypothetical protein [Saccharopolyspora sp. NFXS83]
MSGVADPNESHRDDRSPRPRPTSENTPEVVDAELVVDPPDQRTRQVSATPPDDEQLRQYQQFLEFQKFQEWQRQQGESPGPTGPAAPGTEDVPPAPPRQPRGRPWWKKALGLLRFKLVRRLIYVVLILLLLNWAIGHYFGDSGGSGGGNGGAPPNAAPITPESPQQVIRAFYNYIAHQPEQACALFTEPGKAAFAYHFQSGDCTTAALKAGSQVTEPSSFSSPGFTNDVMQQTGDQALVDSCSLRISGGPPLGKFRMTRQSDGGWQIDQYQPTTCS